MSDTAHDRSIWAQLMLKFGVPAILAAMIGAAGLLLNLNTSISVIGVQLDSMRKDIARTEDVATKAQALAVERSQRRFTADDAVALEARWEKAFERVIVRLDRLEARK